MTYFEGFRLEQVCGTGGKTVRIHHASSAVRMSHALLVPAVTHIFSPTNLSGQMNNKGYDRFSRDPTAWHQRSHIPTYTSFT